MDRPVPHRLRGGVVVGWRALAGLTLLLLPLGMLITLVPDGDRAAQDEGIVLSAQQAEGGAARGQVSNS